MVAIVCNTDLNDAMVGRRVGTQHRADRARAKGLGTMAMLTTEPILLATAATRVRLAAVVMSGKEAATVLARETGIHDVAPADVRELAERGHIRVAVHGWPPTGDLYDLGDFTAVDELRRVGEVRRAWRASSLDRFDAATALGLNVVEFDVLVARHGLRHGRFRRYRRTEVMRLRP